jgi:serine/threonine protein kinase
MLFNNDNPQQDQQKKRLFKGAHIVFQPTPMILQRVMNKCKKKNDESAKPEFRLPVSIVFAWFHDLLSAMSHCHTNHIILRTLHSDQILIDGSGLAKVSGLARSVVLHPLERDRYLDPLSSSKNKKKNQTITDEDIASNPYMAPELLLGSSRYTLETDIWTLGALMAHLLLGKSLFSGKDRKSKLHAIFKISGSPSSTNFKDAQSFPYYKVCKTEKKYKAGVGKAIKYMFKDDPEDSFEHFVPIVHLLEKMLVLDPKERISAVEALKEDIMIEYIKWTETPQYRAKFVTDWNNLRNILNEETSSNTKTSENNANGIKVEILQPKRTYHDANLGLPDEDGLYDMDDLIGMNSKRVKQGN